MSPIVRSRTAARGQWLRRRWRRSVVAGPRGCCWKYCRGDKLVHVGRFSPGAYGFTDSVLGEKYPAGFQLPVDGVPVVEGPLIGGSPVGWFQIPRDTFRDRFNLDYSTTQQVYSHTDWLGLVMPELQVPDIPLDWSDSNLGVCFRSAVAPNPSVNRVRTYGSGNLGDQHTTAFSDILASPGIFFFNQAEVKAVTANFTRAFNGYSVGPNTVNVVVYTNTAVGISNGILNLPNSVYRTYVNALSDRWIGPGHPIPSFRSSGAKPATTQFWTPVYTFDFLGGSVPSPFRRVLFGFIYHDFLFVDRPNIHPGQSGKTTSAPWASRTTSETFSSSLLGYVQDGRGFLRANLSGGMATTGVSYQPKAVSLSDFTPDGRASYSPLQNSDHRDSNSTPQLTVGDQLGTAGTIDIATELPEFINTDSTKAVYAAVSWVGLDKDENDLYTGAGTWEEQFNWNQINTYYPTYKGAKSDTYYFGGVNCTWELVDSEDWEDDLGHPIFTNVLTETWNQPTGHQTEVIPRPTWKANQGFCEDLGPLPASQQATSQPGVQDIGGVNYQASSGSHISTVGVTGNAAAKFCRLDPNAAAIPI